jgi:hypothetical protein
MKCNIHSLWQGLSFGLIPEAAPILMCLCHQTRLPAYRVYSNRQSVYYLSKEKCIVNAVLVPEAFMQERLIIALLLGLCPISTRQMFSYEVQHSIPIARAVFRLDTRSYSVSDVSVPSDLFACLQGIFPITRVYTTYPKKKCIAIAVVVPMASMQEKPIIALILGLCPISTR